MKRLIKNGLVYKDGKFIQNDIFIDSKQLYLAETIDLEADEVIDASGMHIIPGLVDVHVHLREPGFEYKETIKTGSESGVKGGYTTLMCMPNTNPKIDSEETMLRVLDIIKKDSLLKIVPYSCISIDSKGKEFVDYKTMSKYTFAFTDDGFGVQNDEFMEEAILKIKECNGLLVVHSEDEREIKPKASIHDGFKAKELNVVGINSASEYLQVERDLKLVRKHNIQYHVCHVSTKETVELIRQAKKEGLNVSCEVTPHHLLLDESDVINHGNYKMNPPLRTKEDREALIEGILDNTIEVIATDHAPHSKEEKDTDLTNAPFGIVGLETSFGLLYSKFVKTNIITLEKLVDLMSYNPANIFGLDAGEIQNFTNANIAIFNLKDNEKITENNLVSKSKNTPFINYHMQAINYMTIVDGEIVYRKKGF